MGEAMMSAEAPMKAVTVQELDGLIEEMYDQQLATDAAETVFEAEKSTLSNMKARVLTILQQHNKPNYRTGRGLVSVTKRFTVAHPKDPAARAKFFEYLRGKGIFEDLVSVHSQTLNSYYKAEMDAAIAQGNTDFSIPGVAEPKLVETLAMRKGK